MFAGVWITGQGTDGNAVAGNFIGTSVTGTSPWITALRRFDYADESPHRRRYRDQGGASDNRIGTDGQSVDDVGERNVIAGKRQLMASTSDGTGTDGNIVAGNFIGTNVTGTRSLGDN